MSGSIYEIAGNRMRRILMEDDCAPDARIYFGREMEEITGVDIMDFKLNAEFNEPDELTMHWRNKEYLLEYCGDNPFYVLYEKV